MKIFGPPERYFLPKKANHSSLRCQFPSCSRIHFHCLIWTFSLHTIFVFSIYNLAFCTKLGGSFNIQLFHTKKSIKFFFTCAKENKTTPTHNFVLMLLLRKEKLSFCSHAGGLSLREFGPVAADRMSFHVKKVFFCGGWEPLLLFLIALPLACFPLHSLRALCYL